ncbi:PREDICTED: putative mediator of RNA polymerase II transcription subunit 26 [Wasmannia auropunctata]|uniref:putative mediator of RNA polymerase II transcription subunit 26 n=1 Tax=Wasmannia auropunctata TaxID=64793 RepID=UPI0005F02D87|nr:PREDICTED: putative mediator of RNA polymerase II transcription subunit 26 [Wasmannia auropunctata]
MRTCCVSGCSSGKHAPRHTFPKNAERRKKWFQALHMEPLEDENEIKKLRVCYRHFREEDYSGSLKNRVLLHFAFPSVNVPQHVAELVDNVNCNSRTEQREEQYEEQHEEQYEEQHEEQETLHEHSGNAAQQRYTVLQNNENILTQHELQLQLQQMQEIITQQQQRIENIEKALEMQSKPRNVRLHLEDIKRKISLSLKAKKLYDQIVRIKRAKRKQKRLEKIARQQNKSQTIPLHTTDYKKNVDATAHIR